MSEIKSMLKQKANKLPLLPGVYIMRDKAKNVIYVGKAIKLKNRVTQYFGSNTNHSAKVRKMVDNVADFEYIICKNEFEALTLENSLIKQYSPKYNILLKDDKGYHYIHISNEKWRKITAVKNNTEKGEYIGPYNSSMVVKATVEQVQKIFKLPNCSRNFDKFSKPCLNFHLGICMAPCSKKIGLEEYNEAVDSAIRFIKNGSTAKEVEFLTAQMEKAAEQMKFEYAAKLRDRIKAIKKVNEKQQVIINDRTRIDAFASVIVGNLACICMFLFKEGHLTDQEHFIFENVDNKNELYSSFFPQYYALRTDIPKEILIDDSFEECDLISNWLSENKNSRVLLYKPERASKKQIIDNLLSNAAGHLATRLERNIKETAALDELAKSLGLKKAPSYIEAYDISNIGGSENVGAMVVFKDGRPYKNAYRKFKIKGFVGQDDFRSMAEVLDRRMNEFEKGEDEAFSRLPDLILLDGGKGQLSAVKQVLSDHKIDIAVFGMVKDSKHKSSAITDSGSTIAIKGNRAAFSLVTAIQDEVHRFAIGYHRNRRSKTIKSSELLNIEGVGENRANLLLKKFKSIKAISNATVDEILEIKGFSRNVAQNIVAYFRNKK